MTLQVDRHCGHVSCLNHPLLRNHQLLRRKLIGQLVSEDNDTISVLEYALELVHSFKVVDLGQDSNVCTSVSFCVLDLLDVLD